MKRVLTTKECRQVIDASNRFRCPVTAMALRDLFALGVHLLLEGHERAGEKACWTALEAMDLSPSLRRKIMSRLPGNEVNLVSDVWCHCEINTLFETRWHPVCLGKESSEGA